MSRIGIAAYGSLIEDPGVELAPLISQRIANVETPFRLEFARSSRSRDGAPTVVPVDFHGAPVNGSILVLKEEVGIETAETLLWRRETRNEVSDRHYTTPPDPAITHPDRVVIARLHHVAGIDTVLYTSISPNILDPTPEKLASLAIRSVTGKAGSTGKDGISYLMSLRRQGIETPLMAQYEAQILSKLGVASLQDALTQLLRTIAAASSPST